MLTIFTTAKPFVGHNAIIQRNALQSWKLLGADVDVILFGNEEGAAQTAQELGIRHIPQVDRVPGGTKVLRSFFDVAQRISWYDVVCYANCDIILTGDFIRALRYVREACGAFLMVGRRRDVDVTEPIDFLDATWSTKLLDRALHAGELRSGDWIDYFAFRRGFYVEQLPPFVIGRVFWDQWLVWKARISGIPLIDASQAVVAIHQNHDYAYHPAGKFGVWNDALAMRNLELAGGRWHLCTIDDATHVLGTQGLWANPQRTRQAARRIMRAVRDSLVLGALDVTRPVRRALGLRKQSHPTSSSDQSDREPVERKS